MQELIDKIKQFKYSEINEQAWGAYDDVMDIAESLLEKEKEVMCEFAFRFNHDAFTENYIKAEFEETFNNK